jgi:hypothetical protein
MKRKIAKRPRLVRVMVGALLIGGLVEIKVIARLGT